MTIDCLGRENDEFGLKFLDKSRTVQADAKEADINFIVKRFGITGELPQNLEYITEADLVDVPDTYQAHMDILLKAQSQFMEMPADVRSRFANDPGRFLTFVSDPANLDEMRKLGLAVPAAQPVSVQPPAAEVVS